MTDTARQFSDRPAAAEWIGQQKPAPTDQSPYRALLVRLEAERLYYAEAAARTRVDECVISHSSKAAAFQIAAAHLLAVFEGPEVANAYMRDGGKPATQGAFVPPPPGSTEEQLPDDVLTLIDPPPYLSTACETAQLLEQAVAEYPERQAGLEEWARRMHVRCRINHKFTGRLCSCDHHQRQPV